MWKALVSQFEFPDVASEKLLIEACHAHHRAEGAREDIDKNGMTILSGGRLVKNPAVGIERDARAQFFQAMKLLGLVEVHPGGGGRKAGS